jgi:hypothetical protein
MFLSALTTAVVILALHLQEVKEQKPFVLYIPKEIKDTEH